MLQWSILSESPSSCAAKAGEAEEAGGRCEAPYGMAEGPLVKKIFVLTKNTVTP
jgi:hypothetical protein